MYDVIIVGGGPAGLSAGLILGRFRRSVLICDSQNPRNAKSNAVHGFLSRDGIHPQELLKISREQLQAYPTVEIEFQEVTDIVKSNSYFNVHFHDASMKSARKILFATGMKDNLPDIEGMETLWGQGVFHCPYCHGWEVRDKAIAVVANGENAVRLSMLLQNLSSDIVVCTNGNAEISDSEHLQLDQQRIRIIETPIVCLRHQDAVLDGIIFEDGRFLEREAIFVDTSQQQRSTLPARLGCAITDHGHVEADESGKTSVDGVFAAGDQATFRQQVLFAAATGATAAASINFELAQEAFTMAKTL